tara:strand:+ start:706 stop:1671 length:966 start_codon:yes stop_codon:yes gene_type:complete
LSKTQKLSFLKKAFKKANLTSDNENVEVLCPNKKCKSHTTGKLKLIIQLNTQQYHCWVCGESGAGVKRLISKYCRSLLSEVSSVFKDFSRSKEVEEEKEYHLELPKNFVLLAESNKRIDPDIKAAIKYSKSREISEKDFWFFKIGTTLTGQLRRRIIIPSFDKDGELNYYVARTVGNVSKMKYINSKVPKKNIIFNEINIDWSEELTLVEGPFDLIKANENATCLLGCTLKEDQVLFNKIVRNGTPICLALDPDVLDKSYNIARLLTSYGINVRILDCSNYEDVGAMSKNDFYERFQDAKPFGNDDRLLSLISSIKSGSLV